MTSQPAWGFGTTKRGHVNRSDRDFAAISPGSYNVNCTALKKEPLYSMGSKLTNPAPSNMKTPGAGTYEAPTTFNPKTGKSLGKKF